MNKMKVFLGDTCSGYRWRNVLIPMLKYDYYNPIVKNWSETDRLREVKEREYADYVLYVITSGMKGVYPIAEIIDDSNKRPEKTIVCVLFDGINSQMSRSLKAVLNLAMSNGATICSNLEEVATYLNCAWQKRNPTDTNRCRHSNSVIQKTKVEFDYGAED